MSKREYSAAERAAEASKTAGNDAQAEEETPAADLRDTGPAPTPEDGASKDECIPDFPVECLPPVLEREARAISELCRVPLGMVAPMILATASASIGRGLRVRNAKRGITTPANLYVLICKTSGSGGSVTFRLVTAPFVGIQKVLRREFEQKEKPRLDAEHSDISQQIAAAENRLKKTSDAERSEIIDRLTKCNAKLAGLEKRRHGKILFVTDVTPEKLAEMLSHNGETMAHFDSDAADALDIILGTRYGDRANAHDSLWLKSYTGEHFSIGRKNSPSVHLDEPCLAVLFLATPDKVQELYRTPRLTTGGLLPRFLACDPDARPMPIDAANCDAPAILPTDVAQPYEAAIFAATHRYRLFWNEEPDNIDEADKIEATPDEIEATPDALQLIGEDWNRFCAVAKGGADAPFEARHTENAIRIALVLHAFLHCGIEQRGAGTYNARMLGHEHRLDAETMRKALRIRDWFNKHQEKLRAPERAAADDSAWERAESLMRSMPAGITARDLYTGHRVCPDAASAGRLLAQWLEQGRIVAFLRKPEGAGRPTTAYKLAPKVRGL